MKHEICFGFKTKLGVFQRYTNRTQPVHNPCTDNMVGHTASSSLGVRNLFLFDEFRQDYDTLTFYLTLDMGWVIFDQ